VKRAIVTVAALVVCASLASAAGAQTPAQVAKFNRYLSKHPGVAQQFAANGGTYNAAGYPGSYVGMQNYANTYSTQYQKNLATYQNYMLTHPGMAQLAANGYGSPYGSYYPGAQNYPGAYPDPTQQLAANPLMAIVAPLLGSSPGLQNYPGNYGGSLAPVSQPPYYGGGYPMPPAPYAGSGYPMGEQATVMTTIFRGHHVIEAVAEAMEPTAPVPTEPVVTEPAALTKAQALPTAGTSGTDTAATRAVRHRLRIPAVTLAGTPTILAAVREEASRRSRCARRAAARGWGIPMASCATKDGIGAVDFVD